MKIRNLLLSATALVALATMSLHVDAASIDSATARATASSYIKQHAAARPGSLKAAAASDLRLVHAEASTVDRNANAYYAFNIQGGGWIIVAGDDRASQVLGYNDQGQLDFNRLPDNFKALMRSYKEEIEYLQAHPEINVTPPMRAIDGNGVMPLIKTTWGQEDPYDWQCPVYQGEYCVVGCVATAMAQVMYYWKYPTSSAAIGSYYCYDIGQTIPALPETTFNYNLMLPSYCHWDWDNSQLVQDTYTDEQAQEVAKLSRYCGQAVDMGYSPEGSGAYTFNQLDAMITFGYNSSARDVQRSGWWGDGYTTAQWEAMIREELDKRQPILYSASDPAAGGHAFICDGYNADGMFHFNFGWYGTCDGWYASTALNMTHRDGDYLRFNSNHEMLLDVVPPSYCVITADDVTASSNLLVLGEDLDVQASNVNILSTFNSTNLVFVLNDATGKRKATSESSPVTIATFEQGSTVASAINLPTTLASGSYTLQFHYSGNGPSSRITTLVGNASGQLNVVGRLAKYNAPMTIDDLALLIDSLLDGSRPAVTIDDVAALIDALLAGN